MGFSNTLLPQHDASASTRWPDVGRQDVSHHAMIMYPLLAVAMLAEGSYE